MAVFPDRIVHKNSTDDQTTIVDAIGPLGNDTILPGEFVIGRQDGAAALYTLDANNDIVIILSNPQLDSITSVNGGTYGSG